MPAVVAFVSQKGGVAKSTLARAVASVAASAGITVVIADLDLKQQSASRWARLRLDNKVLPAITVSTVSDIEQAIDLHAACELLIVDTPGQTSPTTLRVAERSHVVVVPTGPGLDDLVPTVLLLHEFLQAGVPRERLAPAICRVSTKKEEADARHYLAAAGYAALDGSVPERAAYRDMHNNGRAINETLDEDRDARADQLIDALFRKVIDEIKRHASQTKTARPKKGHVT